MLDLVSGGRVELGTGETSSGAELEGFGVDRETKRAQWEEALDGRRADDGRGAVRRLPTGASCRCRRATSSPSRCRSPTRRCGWPARGARRSALAAAKGIGALSFSFVEPEEAKAWVDEYHEIVDSERCVPGGFAVNPQVAVVLPMMCAPDEAQAIERGIDGAHFFGYSLAHYYVFGDHRPGRTNIWEEFLRAPRRGRLRALDRRPPTTAPLGVRDPAAGAGVAARGDRHARAGARPVPALRGRRASTR